MDQKFESFTFPIQLKDLRLILDKLTIKNNGYKGLLISTNDEGFSYNLNEAFNIIKNTLEHPNNTIKLLDFSNNKLDYNHIKILYPLFFNEHNKVTHLDLSRNCLNNIAIKYLISGLIHKNSKVTYLDLSFCGPITDVGLINLFTNLLQHENNKIEKLNIGTGYDIFNKHSIEALASTIKHVNNRLKALSLNNTCFGSGRLSLLMESLKDTNNKLEDLVLRLTNIDDYDAIKLADVLQHKNNKLIGLDLTSQNITDYGAVILANALKNENNHLRTLYMVGNQCTINGILEFATSIIHENNHLTDLRIVSCRLFDEDVTKYEQFFEAIPKSKLNEGSIGLSFKNQFDQALLKRKNINKCLILCSVSLIKRISQQSSFRKFPVDLCRQLKNFLLS